MRSAAFILIATLSAAAPGAAQEDAPKVAGTDVPAPKRTRFVAPAYPEEAQARGQRGIVILELVIDEAGKVATADVVRSVPPFDEAALSAARQWEYEVTRVDGRPVRVRVTVPITFALKLPEMRREDGVPEMRQGAAPGFPPGLDGPATVVADVTLQEDGSVADALVKMGGSPWAEALLQAIRTWRFAPPAAGARVSFTVHADFVAAGRPGQPPRVDIRLTSPQTTAAADAASAPAPSDPASGANPAPAPEPSPAAGAGTVAEPAPAASAERPPLTVPPTTDPPEMEPAAPRAAPSQAAAEPEPAPAATPAPPVEEIIPAAEPPAPAAPPPPPPQPGFSAVRDVALGIGVPDLVKGRRPVVPPVARMAGQSGHVQLTFAVDAAGITTVQQVEGPELLKEAARQTAASWNFRRTSAERLYLEAMFTFEGDAARAEVRAARQ
jgi:TonB family protein